MYVFVIFIIYVEDNIIDAKSICFIDFSFFYSPSVGWLLSLYGYSILPIT